LNLLFWQIINPASDPQMVGARTGDVPPLPKMPTSMSSGDLSGGLLDTFEDDLTMAIAVRDWDEAVALVKKG
jgi:hypothetical protein